MSKAMTNLLITKGQRTPLISRRYPVNPATQQLLHSSDAADRLKGIKILAHSGEKLASVSEHLKVRLHDINRICSLEAMRALNENNIFEPAIALFMMKIRRYYTSFDDVREITDQYFNKLRMRDNSMYIYANLNDDPQISFADIFRKVQPLLGMKYDLSHLSEFDQYLNLPYEFLLLLGIPIESLTDTDKLNSNILKACLNKRSSPVIRSSAAAVLKNSGSSEKALERAVDKNIKYYDLFMKAQDAMQREIDRFLALKFISSAFVLEDWNTDLDSHGIFDSISFWQIITRSAFAVQDSKLAPLFAIFMGALRKEKVYLANILKSNNAEQESLDIFNGYRLQLLSSLDGNHEHIIQMAQDLFNSGSPDSINKAIELCELLPSNEKLKLFSDLLRTMQRNDIDIQKHCGIIKYTCLNFSYSDTPEEIKSALKRALIKIMPGIFRKIGQNNQYSNNKKIDLPWFIEPIQSGFWKDVEYEKELKRIVINNVTDPKARKFIVELIDIAIQYGSMPQGSGQES